MKTQAVSPIFSRIAFSVLALSPLVPLQAAPDAIAKVGNEEVSADKIRVYFENLTPTERDALEKNPSALNQAVRAVLLQDVLLKEALAAGWDKRPEVTDRIDRVKQGVIVDSYLETVAKVPDDFPSDAEVSAAYDARKDSLQIPKQFQLAQIFIAQTGTDKAATDKARQRAEALQKKTAQPGADFAAIARAESDEPNTASRGGEVGWLTEAVLQPEIRTKVASLGKNAVSEPIKLGDGWYVVKVLDVRDARIASLDEVRPRLVEVLRQERARLNREAYLSRIQQQHPLAINELGLTQLLKTPGQ